VKSSGEDDYLAWIFIPSCRNPSGHSTGRLCRRLYSPGTYVSSSILLIIIHSYKPLAIFISVATLVLDYHPAR
jgi:hypothetical protein